MSSLCIIPARGGSKRIPRKNIKNFCGKPIIAYSINAAIKANIFNEVMVSTDDNEIADIAKKYGAKVPFMRSAKSSDDFASTEDVIFEVVNKYETLGKKFDTVCCLYPCAPFINIETLITAKEKLKEKGINIIFPAVKFSYPILRSFALSDGRVKMFFPDEMDARTQEFTDAYHDAGQFYFLNRDHVSPDILVVDTDTNAIEIPESSVHDIDTEEDWKIAEFKWNYINRK